MGRRTMQTYDEQEVPTIDPGNLDEEWFAQPILLHRFQTALADAELAVNEKKDRIQVLKDKMAEKSAELTLKLAKKDAEILGFKPTVDNVKSWVSIQPEIKKIRRRIHRAQSSLTRLSHNYATIQAMIYALNHKRSALENGVRLFLSDYYSAPSEPKEVKPGRRMADVRRAKIEEKERNIKLPRSKRRKDNG
jgi:chromosome segregation ATPase